MILDIQIQTFGAQCSKVYIFKKIPGGLNINIFLWKSAWSFLLHKRTNAEKQIRNLSFKTTILDPRKSALLVFDEKPF